MHHAFFNTHFQNKEFHAQNIYIRNIHDQERWNYAYVHRTFIYIISIDNMFMHSPCATHTAHSAHSVSISQINLQHINVQQHIRPHIFNTHIEHIATPTHSTFKTAIPYIKLINNHIYAQHSSKAFAQCTVMHSTSTQDTASERVRGTCQSRELGS